MVWEVGYLEEADEERRRLPAAEKNALDHAVEKLEAFGPRLPYPHQSAVRGADNLRELRPRGGRSPWRAFYRRIGNAFVIGSVGPEAESNPQGFRKTVRVAQKRLTEFEAE